MTKKRKRKKFLNIIKILLLSFNSYNFASNMPLYNMKNVKNLPNKVQDNRYDNKHSATSKDNLFENQDVITSTSAGIINSTYLPSLYNTKIFNFPASYKNFYSTQKSLFLIKQHDSGFYDQIHQIKVNKNTTLDNETDTSEIATINVLSWPGNERIKKKCVDKVLSGMLKMNQCKNSIEAFSMDVVEEKNYLVLGGCYFCFCQRYKPACLSLCIYRQQY